MNYDDLFPLYIETKSYNLTKGLYSDPIVRDPTKGLPIIGSIQIHNISLELRNWLRKNENQLKIEIVFDEKGEYKFHRISFYFYQSIKQFKRIIKIN